MLAVNADAALATARELARRRSARRRCSRVASELRFGATARAGAATRRRSPSGSRRWSTYRSPPACTRSPPRKLADAPPDEDALVCGDDAAAKELALELAGRLVAGRAVDAGPLAIARALEGMTAVIVNVNKRYRAHAGIRITGSRDREVR